MEFHPNWTDSEKNTEKFKLKSTMHVRAQIFFYETPNWSAALRHYRLCHSKIVVRLNTASP